MTPCANATLRTVWAARMGRRWRRSLWGVVGGAAVALSGCVVAPAGDPFYYQAVPGAVYPATVQGAVVYPGAYAYPYYSYPYPYYGAPGYYYGSGISVGIYGGGGRYRPSPDRPGFNRPGSNRPGGRPSGATNTNRPGASGTGGNRQPQQPIFRTERDGGG